MINQIFHSDPYNQSASSKDRKDAEQKKKTQLKTLKNPETEMQIYLLLFPSKSPYKMVSFPTLITSSTGKGKKPIPTGQNQLSAGEVPHNSTTMLVVASTARAV